MGLSPIVAEYLQLRKDMVYASIMLQDIFRSLIPTATPTMKSIA
jgi:hypothetical protein